MKRACFLIMTTIMLFSMTACEMVSIGKIGGSDGPTKIFVEKNKEGKQYKSEKEPVRAIMLDGAIYFDTGEDSDINGRCGVLDGSFIKTVDKWELPENDNEANFEIVGKECGYQLGAIENTIEVPIGDDWEIFKKIDDPEKDFSQYKYIFKVEGKIDGAKEEVEYTILSNSLDITANDVANSTLTQNFKDLLDIYIIDIDLD